SVQKPRALADASVRIFVPIMRFNFTPLNRVAPEMLRDRFQDSRCLAEQMLGIYKYFLCTYVEDQPAVIDLRAVILLIWRIWTGNNSRLIIRVLRPTRAPGA